MGGARAGAWLTVPYFTALYVVVGLAGRATAMDDRSVSLVWSAAGVAVLWFLTLDRRGEIAVSAAALVGGTVAINVLTRPSADVVVVSVLGNLAQVAAVVWLVRRWCPELGVRAGRPPLETPGALMRFLWSIAVACTIGVLVGVAGLALVGASVSPLSALAWWGRNVWGVLAIGTTGLLLIHRLADRSTSTSPTASNRTLEAAGLVVATIALVAVDYVSGLPFAFLIPATTVWAGLRFSPLFVSAHAGLGGIAIIMLTLTGHSLFASAGSRSTNVLLAQLFVGMTIMIGLFLASERQVGARLQAELRERQRDLATYARRAAHDLQNPIMLIDGWAGLLAAQLTSSSADGRPPARQLDMVQRIQSATEQMRGLVSDLLADATARDHEMARERVDVAPLVLAIAESRGAQELVRVEAIPPISGDPAMLRRVLDNLIGNALKYVEPGEVPSVELTARPRRDGRVTICVADRGIGIPTGSHEAVFAEFTRAHGDAYPGTGLGLSICRRIIERHGGEIRAYERQPGPGTVVELRLPLWQADPTTHRDEARSPALVSSERAGN